MLTELGIWAIHLTLVDTIYRGLVQKVYPRISFPCIGSMITAC